MGREGAFADKGALPLHPLNGTRKGAESPSTRLNRAYHSQPREATHAIKNPHLYLLPVHPPLVIGCFGFYNRVEPRILGFPFIYAWIFACFFLVSASMCIGWLLDPQSDRNKKRASSSRAPKENAS
ncbi:MAG: DUF3311 domain-containing protein [Bilophila wadsworthia]